MVMPCDANAPLKSPRRPRRMPRLVAGEVIDAFWLRPPPATGGPIEPLSAISEPFLEEAVEPELSLSILPSRESLYFLAAQPLTPPTVFSMVSFKPVNML